MLERLSPVGEGQILGLPQPSATKGAPPSAAPGPVEEDGFPATPPTEVLDALDRAARVMGELGRKNVTVSIQHDQASQQVRATVQHGGSPTGSDLPLSNLLSLLDGNMAEVSSRA